MERPCAWKKYDDEQLAELEGLAERYRSFISDNKTERECVTTAVELARAAAEVTRVGSPAQIAEAEKVLDDARRALHAILAQE